MHRDPGAHQDDVRLVAAVLDGGATAFDVWYRREHPAVYRICFGMLLDPTEADDAAQDAMLHLFDRLDRWDRSRSFPTWRNAIVANLCRDRLRTQAARRRLEARAAVLAADAGERTLPDPGDHAAASEVREAVAACLANLTPREREVFVLKELEGHATPDVAEALDLAESTVRSLLTLARRRLRRLLSRRLPELAGRYGGSDDDA